MYSSNRRSHDFSTPASHNTRSYHECVRQKRLNTVCVSSLRWLLQEKHDVLPDILRLGARVVAHEGLAALGDEELLPIPADVLGLDGAVVEVGRVRKGLARGGAVLLGSRQIRRSSSITPSCHLSSHGIHLPLHCIICLKY